MATFAPLVALLGFSRMSIYHDAPHGASRSVMLLPTLTFAIMLSLIIGPCLVAGECLHRAQIRHSEGNYADSLWWLELSAKVVPILGVHTQYTLQRGHLLYNLDRMDEPEAQLIHGIELESQGKLYAAEEIFWNVLQREAPDTPSWKWKPISREAFRSITRGAIEDLNSAQAGRARDTLRALLQHCSVALKVPVAMQYTSMQTGRAEECTQLVQRIRALYGGFDAAPKRAVFALIESNAARAYYLKGDTENAIRHHRKAIQP